MVDAASTWEREVESLPPGEVCDAGTISCTPDEAREAAITASFGARLQPRVAQASRLLSSGGFCPPIPVGEEDPLPGDHEDLLLQGEVERDCEGEGDPEEGLPVLRVAVTIRDRASGTSRLERSVEVYCSDDCYSQPSGATVSAWTTPDLDVTLLVVHAAGLEVPMRGRGTRRTHPIGRARPTRPA